MPPKNPSEQSIALDIIYQVASDHWTHAEQIRWTLMYNILTANSILVLAWAALFAARTKSFLLFAGLIILCISGLFLNLVWICFEARANGFVNTYAKLGREIEENATVTTLRPTVTRGAFSCADTYRLSINGLASKFSTSDIVTLVPKTFALLFAIQVILSIISVCSFAFSPH